jgi:hypothetical protein
MFTKLKAWSITGFGMLENYPYASVREWVQSQG